MSEAFDLQYVLCIYKDKTAPYDKWAYGIHDAHFHEIAIMDKDLDDIPERLHKALTAKKVEEPNTKPDEKDPIWTTRITLTIDKRFDGVRSINMVLAHFGFSQCYSAEISEDFHRYIWARVGETVYDVRKLLYEKLYEIVTSDVTSITLRAMFNYILEDLPISSNIKDGYLNICTDGIGIIDLSVDICKE